MDTPSSSAPEHLAFREDGFGQLWELCLHLTTRTGHYRPGVRKSGNGRFKAYLHVDGVKKYIGTYETAEEAARVYDRAAEERRGAEAILNFVAGSLNPLRLKARQEKTSTFRGVYFHKQSGRYKAVGRHNNREHYLGYYDTEKDAAMAYDRFVKKRKTSGILNFLENGSLNPHRNDFCQRKGHGPEPAAETTESAEEKEEQDEEEEEEAEGRKKMRRLSEESIMDLTDTPLLVTASSASSSALQPPIHLSAGRAGASPRGGGASAVSGRRAMAAEGGGGPHGPAQPEVNRPRVIPAAPSPRVKVEASSAVSSPSVSIEGSAAAVLAPATSSTGHTVEAAPVRDPPAPLPVPKAESVLPASAPRVSPPAPRLSVSVEATAAVPPSSSAAPSRAGADLKMSLWKAVALLGAEAYSRLVACEVRRARSRWTASDVYSICLSREASGTGLSSSSSSASSGGGTADLRAFLLTSVCPRYTAEALTGSHLDNVMQMGFCIAKL